MDLANLIIKETYKARPAFEHVTRRPALAIREAIQGARRFVLDTEMSRMLGHLSTVPFEGSVAKRPHTLTSMRRGSRLPFDSLFVQLDGKAFRQGLLDKAKDPTDIWGKDLVVDGVVDPIAWLIERHKGTNGNEGLCVIKVTEFFELDGAANTLPFTWFYSPDDLNLMSTVYAVTDDGVRQGKLSFDVEAGQLAHGITGHQDNSIAIAYANSGGKEAIPNDHRIHIKREDGAVWWTHALVAEMGGVVRYVFAFLSTLNEIPVSYERERPTAAYLANGKRRVAVDHEVVKLVLPNRAITYRSFVRSMLRDRIRHKNHPVRGHWRMYGRHDCSDGGAHQWGATDATGHADCANCDASRTWIKDHRRGDEALGRVDRSYVVGAR